MPAIVRGASITRLLVLGAFVYFLLVMVSGFLFGAMREVVFVPAFGREVGEPLETPFILAAILVSAWLTTVWLRVPARLGQRLTMGPLSLAMVLLAELGLSPLVRGSVQAWFDSFTPITLGLAIALWAAHAIMPALVGREHIQVLHT